MDRHFRHRTLASVGRGGAAGFHAGERQPPGWTFELVSARRDPDARPAAAGDGLHRWLRLVRRRASGWASRLGLRGQPRLRLRRTAHAAGDLRRGDRRADRDLRDRKLLGRLLSRPFLVQPTPLVGRQAATAARSRMAPPAGAGSGMAAESVAGIWSRLSTARGRQAAVTGLQAAAADGDSSAR